MITLNPQQILIEELKKVSNNQELIDLAVTLIESNQKVINYSYGFIDVMFDNESKSVIDSDSSDNFHDLLKAIAYNNTNKITITNACQYPDLTKDCVRYLYFKSINIYYKITITKIEYSYVLTKDSYNKLQKFYFNYSKLWGWAIDDDRGLLIYNVIPSTATDPELFATEIALLNKYPDALILT